MWDDHDQSPQSLRPPPFRTFTMEQEERLLKRKAALLDEFLRNGGMEPRAVEDRIQILNERIGSLEAELFQKGRLDSARRYIEHAPQSDFDAVDRNEFMNWFGQSQTITMKPGQTVQANTSDPANSSGSTRLSLNFASNGPGQFVDDQAHNSDVSSSAATSRRRKRARTGYNEVTPCLRCKILKKRCDGDSLDRCGNCAEQSHDSESDFWKVLGCYRWSLSRLSLIFCPAYARSQQRVLRLSDGTTKAINFILTQSRVSDQRRKRILNFIQSTSAFAKLEPSCWEDISERKTLSISASSLGDYDKKELLFDANRTNLEDYEACLAVMQIVGMDPFYLCPTKYNLFLLVSLGNQFSTIDPNSWEIFKEAKRLLRQTVEVYLLERLCAHITSGDLDGVLSFHGMGDHSSNSLVLIDIKDDLEGFLRNIEATCAGRAKLTGHRQLASFYALLVFGIAKSILIDAYSMRKQYEKEVAWKDTDAMAINSAYKTLVSSFCWASKLDVMQVAFDGPDEHNAALRTRIMVHHSKWPERGIKGTKDFLLNLGSTVLGDTSYNGFLVQKFGLIMSNPTLMIQDQIPNPSNHDTNAQNCPKIQSQRAFATADASLSHPEALTDYNLNETRAVSDRDDTVSVGESC